MPSNNQERDAWIVTNKLTGEKYVAIVFCLTQIPRLDIDLFHCPDRYTFSLKEKVCDIVPQKDCVDFPNKDVNSKKQLITTVLESKFGQNQVNIEKRRIGIGLFYPYIYRPFCFPRPEEIYSKYLNGLSHLNSTALLPGDLWRFYVEAARSTMQSAQHTFLHIEPTKPDVNKQIYSHKIREQTIINCTLFEALCKNILVTNNIASINGGSDYQLIDYEKLLPHLRANDYIVRFKNFPILGDVKPFNSKTSYVWKNKTRQSYYFWHAYNNIKHNMFEKFTDATLQAMVESLAAVIIMLNASFGTWAERSYPEIIMLPTENHKRIRNLFDDVTLEEPEWDAIEDYYLPPSIGQISSWQPELLIQ